MSLKRRSTYGKKMYFLLTFPSSFSRHSPAYHPPPPHLLHLGGVCKVLPVIPPANLWLQIWHRRNRVKGWGWVRNQTCMCSAFSLNSSLNPNFEEVCHPSERPRDPSMHFFCIVLHLTTSSQTQSPFKPTKEMLSTFLKVSFYLLDSLPSLE